MAKKVELNILEKGVKVKEFLQQLSMGQKWSFWKRNSKKKDKPK